jgi:serine/threonine-protein kinase HipA
MKRREALQAKDQKRPAKTLCAWDFLLGVQDVTRQGALRFRPSGTPSFLGNEAFAAPPVTTLRELEQVAWQLTQKRIDDLDALRKWLTVWWRRVLPWAGPGPRPTSPSWTVLFG